MGEDAAATARRIVEEILDRDATAGGSAGSGSEARPEPASTPGPDAPTGMTPGAPGAAGDAGPRDGAQAARIARRIVEEALARAEEAVDAGPATPGRSASGADGSGGGLAVDEERTVPIEASSQQQVAEAPDPASPPAPGTGSAADVVSRIVAEVQEPDADAADGDASSGPARSQRPTVPLRTAGAEPVDSTAGTAPATGTYQQEPVPATAPPGPAGHATGDPLTGWAAPAAGAEPAAAPGPAPVDEPGSARTLRWLLASLLGAIALAVLFPLAVAALRALVALD